MSRGTQRGITVSVLVLLVLLAFAAQLLSSPAEPVAGSVESAEPNGRRALLLLLRESGFDAAPWSEAPARLPREQALLWLAHAPPRHGPISGEEKRKKEDEAEDASATTPPAETEKPSPAGPSPAVAGAFGLAHYRAFLEGGGRIVLPADNATRRFLYEDLRISKTSIPDAATAGLTEASTYRDDSGESMVIDVRSGGRLMPPSEESSSRAIVWKLEDHEEVLAVDIPVGRGRVILLGDDFFLGNAKIGERDHAYLALRLAESFAPERRVLFDEYALGTWHPGSPVSILGSAKLFLATLHGLFLLALLLLRSAWVREFARDPASTSTASPLLRARSLAGLLVRAKRFDVLSRFLLEGEAQLVRRRSPDLARDLARRAATPARSAEDLDRLASEIRALERTAG